MLKEGIINPFINSLISRIRHTNKLIIADRGFPYHPDIECIDISLVDDIPTVLDVYCALSKNFSIGCIWMAEEFLAPAETSDRVLAMRLRLKDCRIIYEPHLAFKKRALSGVGLIR